MLIFVLLQTHPTPLLSSPRRKIHFAHHKIPDHTVVLAQTRVAEAASQRIFTKSAKQVPNGIQPWQVGRSAGRLWAMKMSLEVTLTQPIRGEKSRCSQSVGRVFVAEIQAKRDMHHTFVNFQKLGECVGLAWLIWSLSNFTSFRERESRSRATTWSVWVCRWWAAKWALQNWRSRVTNQKWCWNA